MIGGHDKNTLWTVNHAIKYIEHPRKIKFVCFVNLERFDS